MSMKKVALIAAVSILVITSVASTLQRTESVESNLTLSEIQTAEVWNLSQSEFTELKNLKLQHRGMLSSDLTPLEWLGIFAETEEQRNHYANIFARRQIEITSAILKFERAYAKAIKSISSQASQTPLLKDRLLLVTEFQCTDSKCSNELKEALTHVNRGGYLDIYVQDRFTDSNLKDWAVNNRVSLTQIRKGQITINQAKGRMLNVKPGIYRAK